MKLDFEYGHGLMSANLPDNTDVFGVGMDHNICMAAIKGVLSAINRAWCARHSNT